MTSPSVGRLAILAMAATLFFAPAAQAQQSKIAAGDQHTCVVMVRGTVKCWGSNAFGQLGTPTTPALFSATPVTVAGLTNVASITAGLRHTCAVIVTGGFVVKC